MRTEATIKEQQAIADKLLSKLRAVDPYCILAGGAPMDWYLGKPANDLDIYFYAAGDTSRTTSAVNSQLDTAMSPEFATRTTRNLKGIHDTEDEAYRHMKYLRRIIDLEVDGMPVQLIEMLKPAFDSVVPQFASDNVKFWYKSSKTGVEGTARAYLAHYFRVVSVCYPYTSDSYYIKKLKDKLPGYALCSESDILERKAATELVRNIKTSNGKLHL